MLKSVQNLKPLGVYHYSGKPGYRLTEIGHKVDEGICKAFYVFGEDPAQTEADLAAMRETMRKRNG